MADGSVFFDTKLDNSGFQSGLDALVINAKSALLDLGQASVKTFTDFQDSMLQVKATMNASEADYQRLSAFAREMGSTTRYSGKEAADALNYLALAGYDAEKAIAVLPQVLRVAQAGGLDLAKAADFVTDNMAALGLEIENLNDFTDKLARTSQKSNTSIGQLGEAIQTASGTARQTGQNIDEINAVLGVFANNGLKGAEAGTAYRNMLLALASPTDKARSLMAQYGISVYDSAGNMRQMSDVMTDFNAALAAISQEERTNVLSNIFNKVDLNAANFLLNSTSGEFQNLSNEITNASGAAQEMADTMEEGLGGALRNFSSFIEEQMLQLGEALETPVTDALTVIQDKIADVMPELVRKLEEILPQVGATLAEILPLLIELGADALPVIATFLQAILPLVQMFSSFLNENSAAVRFWLPLIVEAGIAVQVLSGAVAFFKTVTAITAGLSAVSGGIGGIGTAAAAASASLSTMLANLGKVAAATGSKIAAGAVTAPAVLGTAAVGSAYAGAKIGVAIDPNLNQADWDAFFGKTGKDFFYKAMNAWTGNHVTTPSEQAQAAIEKQAAKQAAEQVQTAAVEPEKNQKTQTESLQKIAENTTKSAQMTIAPPAYAYTPPTYASNPPAYAYSSNRASAASDRSADELISSVKSVLSFDFIDAVKGFVKNATAGFTPAISTGTVIPAKAAAEISAGNAVLKEVQTTSDNEVIDALRDFTQAFKNQQPITVTFALDGLQLQNFILDTLNSEVKTSNGRSFA